MVIEGKTGWRYPMGDIDALANCMTRMANDPDSMRKMGEEAAHLSRSFSVERTASAIAETMEQVWQVHCSKN